MDTMRSMYKDQWYTIKRNYNMGKAVKKVTGALGLTADPNAGSGAMAGAFALQARAVKELEKIGIPAVEAQKLVLEQPELVMSTLEEKLGSSAMEDIKTDARLQDTQMKSLAELEKAGEEGFTAEDKARFEALRTKIGSDEKGRQATILQQMAQRGALDSGAQLAAQLGSSQASAQRASDEATQMAGQQAQARRGALAQAAQTAGQMQQTQFGQQAQQASAQDRISAFNASVAARDTGARQQHAQQVAQLANQQQMHNKGLIQQNFQNQMAKATGMVGALGNQAQGMMQQGASQARAAQQDAAGMRQLAIGGASAAMGARDGGIKYAGGGIGLSPEQRQQLRDNQVAKVTGSGGYDSGLLEKLQQEQRLGNEQDAILGSFDDQIASQMAQNPNVDTSVTAQATMGTPDAMASAQATDPVPTPKAGPSGNGLKSFLEGYQGAQEAPIAPVQVGNINPNDVGAMIAQSQQGFADGGMNYESGGEGTIIESGMEDFTGDELPDRINDGEMVLNLDQQDTITELLQELAQRRRGDEMVDSGEAVINEPQQDTLMAVARGEAEPEDLDPEAPIVERGDSTASDLESLLGELEKTGEDSSMDSYIDPEFVPLPQEEVEQFMDGGIRRSFQGGGYLDELTSIPGIEQMQPSLESTQIPYRPEEEQQIIDNEELSKLAQMEVDATPPMDVSKSELEMGPTTSNEAELIKEYDSDPIEISAKEEKPVDEELESARRKDMIVNLLQSFDKGLSHFDAANPNVMLNRIKPEHSKSSLEKKLQQARKMAEATTDKKKLMDLKEREVAVKEKGVEQKAEKMSDREKIKYKSELKEEVDTKKEAKKDIKEVQSSLDSVREKKQKIQKAMELLEQAEKSKLADTGPVDQYLSKTTDLGQQLEQSFNDLALDKMTKMFKGMSKAIDSDSERKFFMNAQAGMNKYPKANKAILKEMMENADSLEQKLQAKMQGGSPQESSEKSVSGKPSAGDTVIVKGKRYRVKEDGDTLEEIK